MSVMAGLYALLAATPGVTAVVPAARIYPVLLPITSALPAITYQVVGGSSSPTFDTSGAQKLRVQFDCHGASYAAADGAREALRIALNGFRGVLADETVLQNAELLQSIDFFDDEPRTFRCSVEFYLYYDFVS